MHYFYTSILGWFLLSSGGIAVAEGSVKAQEANQYPAEFVQSYNQECLQTSIEEGLAEAEAQELCDCTINEFERQYTQAEFQQLTAASASDPEAETALVEVGQLCFEQILYEE